MDGVKRQEAASANGIKRFFAPVINLLCGRKGERCTAQTPEVLSVENADRSLPCRSFDARQALCFQIPNHKELLCESKC